MININFSRLTRKQLMEHFERERQEWLAAGMSESDIYRIHFGESSENGRGGDYRIWLDERRHSRADHKYAPGTPIAIDAVDPSGTWISGDWDGLDDAERRIDIEAALSKLTELQRFCLVEVCIYGHSYSDVARKRGKHHSTIQESVISAKAKIKKFLL